jgi:hypothetical protein
VVKVGRFFRFVSAVFLSFMLGTAVAAPITIDFNALSSDGTVLLEQGFVFDPGARDWSPGASGYLGHYHIASPNEGWLADNGSNFMVVDYFLDNSTLNIYAQTGASFGLQSIDLAEALILGVSSCSAFPLPAYQVSFTGLVSGGGTVARSVTLDMQCDGAGPRTDFQAFVFDASWSSLAQLTIRQLTLSNTPFSHLGIDNVVLRAVPEPHALALIALAVAGLGYAQRKRNPH